MKEYTFQVYFNKSLYSSYHEDAEQAFEQIAANILLSGWPLNVAQYVSDVGIKFYKAFGYSAIKIDINVGNLITKVGKY